MTEHDDNTAPLPADVTIAASARLFAAVAAFRAKDDIRYYLQGVHIAPAPEGVYLVATDGHQLAVAHDRHGHAPEPTIMVCSQPLVAAARKHRSGEGHVVLQAGRVRVLSSLIEERFVQAGPALMEGNFPDFLAIMVPALGMLTHGANGCYAARLIERLNKVGRDLSDKFTGLQHWSTPTHTLFSRFPAEANLMVITMPMHGADLLPSALPDGLQEPVAAARLRRPASSMLEEPASEPQGATA